MKQSLLCQSVSPSERVPVKKSHPSPRPSPRNVALVKLLALGLGLSATQFLAQRVHATRWTGAAGDGNWSSAANWSPDYDGGSTPPVSGNSLWCDAQSTLANHAVFTAAQGTLSLNNIFMYGSASYLEQTGGTLNSAYFGLATDPGSTSTFSLSGGTNAISGDLNIGANGTGTINQSGGAMVDSGTVNLGTNSSSTGTLNLSGGTFTANHELHIGQNGAIGTVNVSGSGTLAVNSYLGVGHIGGGKGTLNVNGGQVTQGTSGNGSLEISASSGDTGTVNLNGGTLTVQYIVDDGGTSTFNFNGGTLQASSNDTTNNRTFLTGLDTANVRNGGAVIDTNGYNITIAQALLHSTIGGDNAVDGGLTKNGAGVLTLSGANTYTGNTTLNAGTLSAGNTAAFGTGTLNLVGGTLTNSVGGVFTVGNSLAAATGGNVSIRSTAGSLFVLGGNLTGSGSIDAAAIYNASGLQFAGDASGYTGTLTVSGANVRLTPNASSAGANYVVNGGLQLDSGNGATYNLGSLSGGGEVGSHSSNVLQTISVGALNTDTTFSGKFTNIINDSNGNTDGAANSVVALTKVGTGTLTLSGVNDYTGNTTVNGGKLLVNGSTAGGSAVAVNNGGTVLGGTGTVNGAVTVGTGATLQGGAGTASGALTLASTLTLNSGSILAVTLDASGAHSTITYASGGFNGFNANQMWMLGGTPQVGFYDNVFTGVISGIDTTGWTVTNNGYAYSFTDDGSNIDLNITAVPEPATVFGGLLLVGVTGYRGRRRLLSIVRAV